MVWRFPPERAGRAPQASRHSNNAEVVAVRFALVVEVGAGGGAESGLGPVSESEAEFMRVVLEHAATMDATPALPASASNSRRLKKAGRPDAGSHTVLTIRA